MAGARFQTKITKTGPLFTHDPAKTVRDNLHDMMLGIAELGRDDVIAQMVRGEPGRAPIRKLGDRVADHVVGELRKRPAGSRYTAVIFVRNKGFTKTEAISLMAAASRLESSIHAFRRTYGRLRANWRGNVDVFKGLN